MTKEDKELLLKDLSARLLYGIILDIDTTDWKAPQGHIQVKIEGIGFIGKDMSLIVNGSYYGDNYKPYLRPMSSMTEKEKEEYDHRLECMFYNTMYDDAFAIDWLNAHHFDYRGLIEKNLAIAVTKENNPYKK